MTGSAPLGRRSLLAGVGATLLLSACSEPSKTGAPSTQGTGLRKISYGTEHRDQYGVLGMPTGTPKGLAILVHGGYWLDQYGAGLMDPMATDLRERGYATWNIEYRRLGSGGGYPATFNDVAAAFDKVRALGVPGDVPRFSLGHSAGGQLAVWAASRTAATPGGRASVVPATTISLSGVLNLTAAAAEGLGNGAAAYLMGKAPFAGDSDYARADPTLLVPARTRVVAVHAESDEIVPREQSTSYVTADTRAGGKAELVLAPGGHFDLIDPKSAAWTKIVTFLP